MHTPLRQKTPANQRIKLLIIDDSAVVRQVITQAVARDSSIEVIATASDPVFALSKMKIQWPDVIILDIEMPRMDGLTFLRRVMSERPTPIIICSSLVEKGAETSMQALSAGAVSIIAKPKSGLKGFLEDASNDIVTAIRAAARSNLNALRPIQAASSPLGEFTPPPVKNTADVILAAGHPSDALLKTTDKVIAMGTSTGGTQALESVLTRLPLTVPGIVIVQHMPETFTGLFSARLNTLCKIEVREAKNNDRVLPGTALIAPGGKHMLLKRSGAQYYVEIVDGPLVNRHKPSVDVLFRSVAKFAGANALGIIMTGMGDDGARGLLEMSNAGADTLAQDEASCVVFGMPKAAIHLGAAKRTLSLEQIPAAIIAAGKDL